MTIGNIKESIMVLLNDMGQAEDVLDKNPADQFFRRVYVRNSFSYIEGSVWILMQVCLKAKGVDGRRRMTIGEFNILNEISFDLKANGNIKESVKFLKLTDILKFLFKSINKLFNAKIEIDYGATDWQNFY